MGVFFSCPSPLQTSTKFWSLKPIVPSWRDTDKIYSNSQKCWHHTLAFSGPRPVKPLSSHPTFVSTSGYKVSSEMQAFPLNIWDSLTIQQAVWRMSFHPHHSWTLLFHLGSDGYTAVVALQHLILKSCTSGFPVEISFRKENIHLLYV